MTDRETAEADAERRTDPTIPVDLDDLSPLEVQVRALREDLAGYRTAIETVLRRRLWALGTVLGAGVLSVLVIAIGATFLVGLEADRADRTLATARAESCSTARTVQAQIATILSTVSERSETGTAPWLEDAIREISTDPCPPTVPDRP